MFGVRGSDRNRSPNADTFPNARHTGAYPNFHTALVEQSTGTAVLRTDSRHDPGSHFGPDFGTDVGTHWNSTANGKSDSTATASANLHSGSLTNAVIDTCEHPERYSDLHTDVLADLHPGLYTDVYSDFHPNLHSDIHAGQNSDPARHQHSYSGGHANAGRYCNAGLRRSNHRRIRTVR